MIRVLIPFRSNGDIARQQNLEVVLDWWHRLAPAADLQLCDDPDPDLFNRGRAIQAHVDQIGEEWPDSDVLVFADADLILPAHAIRMAIGALLVDLVASYVVPFTQVDYLSAPATETVWDGCPADAEGLEVERTWDRLSTGGVNVTTVDRFRRIGFDPRFHGWGFEDSAFDIAARTCVGPVVWIQGAVRHLHHVPSPEADPTSANYQASLALCRLYEQADGDAWALGELRSSAPPEW